MADYLKSYSAREVADFFRRLALAAHERTQGKSLAAEMLLHWLDGNGQGKIFNADYLRDINLIDRYLQYEVRPVFLTQARFGHTKTEPQSHNYN